VSKRAASEQELFLVTSGREEALFEAVYRDEVDPLGELAERLASEAAHVEALRRGLHANLGFVKILVDSPCKR